MPNLGSVAEWMGAVRNPLPEEFRDRLALTLLATVLDFGVIGMAGPVAFQCASISLGVPVAFSILAVGLFAVLGYMWFLTVKSWPRR